MAIQATNLQFDHSKYGFRDEEHYVKGQHQDAGAKMVHIGSETTSRITNKSVLKKGGRTTYRGLAKAHRLCPARRSTSTATR